MRERFDAGTGLVAVGAVLLFISLFVDWFRRGGDAWAVFEMADIVLAACAVAGLAAVVPRYTALARAVPWISLAALVIVAVQLVDPPPSVRGDTLETGAWLALAATLLMALGAALTAASISITVDVHERERRRRTAAIDARDAAAAPAVASEEPADARRGRRRASAATAAAESPAAGGPAAEESRRTRRAAGPAAAQDDQRRARRPAEGSDETPAPATGQRRARRGADPAPATTEEPPARRTGDATGETAEPPPDPDRTQALDPIDRPADGP